MSPHVRGLTWPMILSNISVPLPGAVGLRIIVGLGPGATGYYLCSLCALAPGLRLLRRLDVDIWANISRWLRQADFFPQRNPITWLELLRINGDLC